MKTHTTIHLYLIPFFVLFIGFAGCNKKNEDEATQTTGTSTTSSTAATGRIMFHLHTYIGTTEVDDYNITYTDENGRKMLMQLAQYYVSGIQLERLDGSLYDVPNTHILKLLDVDTYLIGDVPAGNYQSIRFKVGLDSITNHRFPPLPADTAILGRPEMWFGNSPTPDGYVFLHAKGMIDTTSDASGTANQLFDYKIGTGTHLIQVNMPVKKYSILPGGIEYAHILVDFSKLFNGVNLSQSDNFSITTAAENNTTLATKISGNIASMFSYEE